MNSAVAVAVLCCSPVVTAVDDEAEELGGWQQDHIGKPDEWQELDSVLPAYPEKKNLMDLGISTDGMQYTVYLDKPSLVIGADRVVRYTVVLIPPSGVWNVSFEGLLCGEKQYRRIAYGIDGKWVLLKNAAWQGVRGTGANRYRRILYEQYFCNPMRSYKSPGEMIDSFTENWHEM